MHIVNALSSTIRRLSAIAAAVVMGFAAVGATAGSAAAQGVVGHLYDFDSGAIVATAEVVMTNADGDTVGRAISDRDGRFVILVEFPGNYALAVTRLGYASQMDTEIVLEGDRLQEVEITVHGAAVELEGLVVSTTPRVRALNALGFYERKDSGRRGAFVLPTEVEKEQAFSTSGLLPSVPGITMRDGVVRTIRRAIQGPDLRMSACALKVLLNGVDVGINVDEAIRRYDVSAIEVYNSLGAVPPQYLGSASSGIITQDPDTQEVVNERTCGAVVVWTVFGGD